MATSHATEFHNPAGPSLDGIVLAEELLDLAERAQAYTNAAGVAIALRRGQELVVRTSTGAAPEVGSIIPMSDAFIADCLKSRRPLVCRDAEADSRVGKLFRDTKTRSMIAVPMCEHREAKGVMIVMSPLANAFQPTHTAILMTLTDIIASKLAAREAMPEFDAALLNDSAPEPLMAAEPARAVVLPEPPKPTAPAFVAPPIAKPTPAVAVPEPPKVAAKPAVAPEVPKAAPKPVVAAQIARPVPKPLVMPQAPKPARVEPLEAARAAEPAKPAVVPLPPIVPPALLRTAPLPMEEEKAAKREPGLLSPSEDPKPFKTEPLVAHSSTVTPQPTPASVHVRTSAPAAIAPLPAISAWEVPQASASNRPILMGVGAVAAALVLTAGLWIYRTMSKEVSAPVAAIPKAAAISLPPSDAAAAPPASIRLEAHALPLTAKPEQPKASKPSEVAPSAEPKRHSPVIEISAAQPRPEAELDMPAPKLSLASNDGAVSNLARVSVAMPSRPASELVPASLISRVAPSYPQLARQMGISGAVVMSVTISPQGTVSNVRVVSGAGQLRGAALEAVRQWRYKPALLNGKPTESSVDVQVNFAR